MALKKTNRKEKSRRSPKYELSHVCGLSDRPIRINEYQLIMIVAGQSERPLLLKA